MKQKKGSKLLFFIILGIIFITGFLVVLINFLVNNSSMSCDEVLEKFRKGIVTMDSKVISETLHPNFIKVYEKHSDNTYEEELQSLFDEFDKITDYDIDHNYYTPTPGGKNEFLSELEDAFNIDKESISEVRLYNATVRFKYDDEYEVEDDEVVLFEVDNSWYVYHDDFVDDIIY